MTLEEFLKPDGFACGCSLSSRRMAAYDSGATIKEIQAASGPGSTSGYYWPYGFMSRKHPPKRYCADCERTAQRVVAQMKVEVH